MSEETRNSVTNYLDNVNSDDKAPLYFCNEEGRPANLGLKKAIKTKKISDLDLLRLILTHKEHFYSKNVETHDVETMYGKHRSSLDIWRHFIFYRPDTTLLDVMAMLKSISNELRYQYCHLIHKRVFDLASAFGNSLHDDARMFDEYGIPFSAWENINVVVEDEREVYMNEYHMNEDEFNEDEY